VRSRPAPVAPLFTALFAVLAVTVLLVVAPTPAESALPRLPGTRCPVFPADNYWHARVSGLPVHPRSGQWLAHMSPDRRLHPDFGPSFGAATTDYGIPVTVVGGAHPKVGVRFTYRSESDRMRYPLGRDTRIEGGRASDGDRHAIVVDRSTCRLYETWATQQDPDGTWRAGSGASWRLRSNLLRPQGWTSADAAGLPILPGLLRYDEVLAGRVDHAVRFTTDVTDRAHIWPARHDAGSVSDPSYPPMGARFRLKASYPIASYGRPARTVLRAMKTYGLVLADNGSPWFFQGTRDTRWSTSLLDDLKRVPASAFEAVDTAPLRVGNGSARAR
jgi:hypothetical protein